MECEKHLTGYFKDGDRSVVFSSDNYCFDFMTGEVVDYNTDKDWVIQHKDGFLYGKTFTGKSIAVYCGEYDFHVLGKRSLIIPAYVLSKDGDEIRNLREIRFIGGTLNELNYFTGYYETKDNEVAAHFEKKPILFDCKTSNYTFHVRIEVTKEKSNKTSLADPFQYSLTISFDEDHSLISVFEHYLTLQRILSFLTRQQEVGFEKIILRKWNDFEALPEEYWDNIDFAHMYIREEIEIPKTKVHNNITFDDLGSFIQQLFSLFYSEYNDKKQNFLPKAFYPENTKEALTVTTEMIKSSCAIIETLTEVDMDKNEDLEKLIDEVKKTIKEFKKKGSSLSETDFNYYLSSLKFWRQTLKSRILSLFRKYDDEIKIIQGKFERPVLYCEQDIQDYINFRNTSTHALNNHIEGQTGIIQLLVTTCIYCMVLEKVGFSKDEIDELCKNRILNWR